MPEGWGGGGDGLQNDGSEKRGKGEGERKKNGWIQRRKVWEKGVTHKATREEENSVLVG